MGMSDGLQIHQNEQDIGATWAKLINSAANKRMESNYAVADAVKKMVTNNASDKSKRACLCAPTTHAGSFRCRFHRKSAAAQMPPALFRKKNDAKVQKLTNPKRTNGQSELSRFGKAATATASDQLIPAGSQYNDVSQESCQG